MQTEALNLNCVKVTSSSTFAKLYAAQGKHFPCADNFPQSVTINFTAGFGDSCEDIPQDIKSALLAHIAAMWADRGDCSVCDCDGTLPNTSKLVYDTYRVTSINVLPICHDYYGCC